MKRMILMMLLTMSVSAVASDVQNKIFALLNQNATATELDWRNKNLGNRDFEGLGIVSHVKKLDLGDNDFSGDFPLTACLRVFPNLETLSINNNTRVTGFSIDKDYKNTTLKVLNVENSGCEKMPVSSFYKNFELETLDLSNSKQLVGPGCYVENLRASGKVLQVYLHNVVAGDKQIQHHNANGVIDTKAVENLKLGCFVALYLVGTVPLLGCEIISPNYCMYGFLPPFHYNFGSARDYATLGINQVVWTGISLKLGLMAGGAIARCCLSNGGKVTAVKYITSSVDEMV